MHMAMQQNNIIGVDFDEVQGEHLINIMIFDRLNKNR
jgi:hypothetical protein